MHSSVGRKPLKDIEETIKKLVAEGKLKGDPKELTRAFRANTNVKQRHFDSAMTMVKAELGVSLDDLKGKDAV